MWSPLGAGGSLSGAHVTHLGVNPARSREPAARLAGMSPARHLAFVAALATTSLLSASTPADTSAAPRVTRMHLTKGTHTLALYDGDTVVASFLASLGPGGLGFKRREGDNVTPNGHYHVLSHQRSRYRVFLRLDYPNAEDRARFAALKASGELPIDARIGGDIGIHGTPQGHAYDDERASFRGADWTLGCIGVQDDEIDRIAAWVRDGTGIDIED
jgi:murein L,D-transpeptidase YafK